MSDAVREDNLSHPREADVAVGPFTGFGNFFRKEMLDWWNSWRLLVVFAVPTLIATLLVFFQYTKVLQMAQLQMAQQIMMPPTPAPDDAMKTKVATRLLLALLLQRQTMVLLIFIVIFSTMGILTLEKSTGTLAWNLTKPLGRTGLFLAKWIVAVGAIWLAMCVLPVAVASICMIAYHHVVPNFAQMAPIVAGSLAWIALWVLLVLTISLGFQSQGAVGGITIAFWAVPNILGFLLESIFGTHTKDWILDRLATNSPFFIPAIVGDKELFLPEIVTWKYVWLYSLAAWFVVLMGSALRVFNRQEVGS